MIVRGRWWILSAATLVSVATVAALYNSRYTSEATLLVVPQQVPARYVTPTTETNIADALQAMTQDVLSRAGARTIGDPVLGSAKERQRLAPEEVIELMRKYIEISLLIDSRSQRYQFVRYRSWRRSGIAQEVTSKLTSFFIQANLKTREDQAANTTNFLQAQLESAKNKLCPGRRCVISETNNRRITRPSKAILPPSG